MSELIVKLIDTNENGVTWYEVTGNIHGFDFNCESMGMTIDDRVLDCDGCPVTPGDHLEIAMRAAMESRTAIIPGDDCTVEVLAEIHSRYEYADEQISKHIFDRLNNMVRELTDLEELDRFARSNSVTEQ